MAKTPKSFQPLDSMVATIIKALADKAGLSLRNLQELTGISHNRIGKILRQEPPPPSIGELGTIAGIHEITASQILELAEQLVTSGVEPSAEEIVNMLNVRGRREDYAKAAHPESIREQQQEYGIQEP